MSPFPAMVLFNAFKGQTTDSTYHLLEQNNISVVNIPPNCTNKLQPMDLSVNKSLKKFLKKQWYLKIWKNPGKYLLTCAFL